MRVFVSTAIFPLIVGSMALFTCAQRDNSFDPGSPLYRLVPPVLEISIADLDTARVESNRGDSQFVIIPPATVTLSAYGFDTETRDSLPVFLSVTQNGVRIDRKDSITSVSSVLNDSGIRVFTFETEDQKKQRTIKNVTFIIKPDSQPRIVSFQTEFDTVRIGKNINAMFTLEVTDSALLLDSLIYISMSNVLSEHVKSKQRQLYDTCFFSLFSSDTGKKEVLAIAIDEIGRRDTSRIIIVFDTIGKIGDKRPPHIQNIRIETADSLTFCFDPEVTIYNGNASEVSYYWYIDKTRFSKDRNPCQKFGIAGTHDIVLKVEDEVGATSWDTIQLVVSKTTVKFPKIDSLMIKPKNGSAPLYVNLKCYLNSEYTNNAKLRVTWNFGDGSTHIGINKLIEDNWYGWPGIYYPKVIVCNDAGCDTIRDTIAVGLMTLKADPSKNGKVGEEIKFSIDGFNRRWHNFIWSFPGIEIRNNINYCKFTFKKPGTYTIFVSVVGEKSTLSHSTKLGEITYTVTEK